MSVIALPESSGGRIRTQTRAADDSHRIAGQRKRSPSRTEQIAQHTTCVGNRRARKEGAKEARQHQRLEVLRRRASKAKAHSHKHRCQHRQLSAKDLRQWSPQKRARTEAEEEQRRAQHGDLVPDVEFCGDLPCASAVCRRCPRGRHGRKPVHHRCDHFLFRGPIHRTVWIIRAIKVHKHIRLRLLMGKRMRELLSICPGSQSRQGRIPS